MYDIAHDGNAVAGHNLTRGLWHMTGMARTGRTCLRNACREGMPAAGLQNLGYASNAYAFSSSIRM